MKFVIVRKIIFWFFQKKILKFPIFWHRTFSKSHIWRAAARATVWCFQGLKKSYKYPQKNFKRKNIFCHKSVLKPTQIFFLKIQNSKKISKKNTKNSRFLTFFFLKSNILCLMCANHKTKIFRRSNTLKFSKIIFFPNFENFSRFYHHKQGGGIFGENNPLTLKIGICMVLF